MEGSDFEFKRFGVCHKHTAMKVGTDGVLLGAWADLSDCNVVWDVGCGCGLIALMLAQRGCGVSVEAIEIDSGAAEDAAYNVVHSPWIDRICVRHADVFEVADDMPRPDMIVCNPPFFVDSLKARGESRNMARHEDGLGCETLIRLAARILAGNVAGRLCMVTPADRRDDVEWWSALCGMHVHRLTEVKTVERKPARRLLWDIRISDGGGCVCDTLCIHSGSGGYSTEYMELTKDFYLNF